MIEVAQKNNIKGNYSLKPTMFGILLNQDVCYKHIREIVAKAASYNNFVRVDIEILHALIWKLNYSEG